MRLGVGDYISAGLYIATAIACLAFIIFRIQKHYRRSKEHTIMTYLLWNLVITGIVEATKIILAHYNAPNLIEWQRVGSYLYFIIHTTLSPAFVLYVLLINGAAKNKGKSFYYILFSIMLIPELLVLTNPMTKIVYYYNVEDGVISYHRGWAMWILYVVAAAYLAYGIVFLVKSWNVLKNNYMKGYAFFLIMIVLGILIQLVSKSLFGETYEVEAFFETIALLGLLVTVDCNDSLIDRDTKFRNNIIYEINVKLYKKYNYKYTTIHVKFANLAYYKNVLQEDSYDSLIDFITNRLTYVFNKEEIYRYDNSTFVIVLPKHPLCEKWINELKEIFEKPIDIHNSPIFLQTVITVAKVPNDIDTLEEHRRIMNVKPDGDNVVTIRLGEDLKFLKRHSLVDEAIHRAIKDKSFMVYYQPIWSKDTNSIVSCEALCRLNDKELGFIPPSEFIPIAEETGSIIALGEIVIEKVCKDISELRFQELGIHYVELNLSLYQLRSKNLVSVITENLKRYNVPSSMLNLEITESRDLEDTLELTNLINTLTDKGFSFSLDDYGTAYSNLTNVISINYKNIKIDASILWKSITDFNTRQLLELTIKTFRNFGNNIIQEGVETKEQLDLVTNAGANLIQGYYFSKPLPRLEFVEFVKNFKNKNE